MAIWKWFKSSYEWGMGKLELWSSKKRVKNHRETSLLGLHNTKEPSRKAKTDSSTEPEIGKMFFSKKF